MIPAFRTRALDLGFVVALAAMAAVPLLLFAAIPALNRPECLVGFVGPFVAIAALWTVAARRREDAAHLPGPDASGPNGGSRRDVWWVLVVAALLAAVTYVAFYAPLRIHFWMGYDDVIHFRPRSLTDWLAQWRGFDAMNRPLTMLPSAVGHALTPGRIDGLLWVGAGLCWLNGLLLFALLG